MKWFGAYWPSPLTWNGDQVSTPVGCDCRYCPHVIMVGDQGVIIDSPFFDAAFISHPVEAVAYSRERHLRRDEERIVFHRRCFSEVLKKVDGDPLGD